MRIQENIQAMIERPGLYALYIPGDEGVQFVPVFSRDGELWSLRLDSILTPDGFHQNVLVQGPCTGTGNAAG